MSPKPGFSESDPAAAAARTPAAGDSEHAGSTSTRPADISALKEHSTVAAGCLTPWEVGTLDPSPSHSWRDWKTLIGPGILLAGSSVGAGEWLFGPAVSAQFGGTFLWLATISIVTQTFYNLEVMRYTLYCGEPIFVGFFRLRPGPQFWTVIYLLLCVAHIWPFMASNAAVPLSAAILGHLPGDRMVHIASWSITEPALVKSLGYVIFLLAFLPLIFGGKIYNVLEKMMTLKLVIVLGFLVSVSICLISPRNAWEVTTGFFRFGQVALRAETVIAGPHFDVRTRENSQDYVIRGTFEDGKPVVTKFGTFDEGKTRWIDFNSRAWKDRASDREALLRRVEQIVKPGRFLVEKARDGKVYRIAGDLTAKGWVADHVTITDGQGKSVDQQPADLTGSDAAMVDALVHNEGFERVGIPSYWKEHGRLPGLDWFLLASFAAIAGAGMLSNALFSNYARDKGWGMGAQTGAIPSAIGGHRISLSHVGKVFTVTDESVRQFRGWFRHIVRDQYVWLLCSVIGMALPCMMSLEFIRNAPVSDNRVAALTADGLATRYPSYAGFWWVSTLFVGFMVLAPNAVFAGDLIARLWTDLIWIGRSKGSDRPGRSVMRVYYGILIIYCIWGLISLTLLSPLQIATMGAVLGNVALGFSSFHTLAVNRRLLPKELQPNWFMQLGLIACGVFFIGITIVIAFAPQG